MTAALQAHPSGHSADPLQVHLGSTQLEQPVHHEPHSRQVRATSSRRHVLLGHEVLHQAGELLAAGVQKQHLHAKLSMGPPMPPSHGGSFTFHSSSEGCSAGSSSPRATVKPVLVGLQGKRLLQLHLCYCCCQRRCEMRCRHLGFWLLAQDVVEDNDEHRRLPQATWSEEKRLGCFSDISPPPPTFSPTLPPPPGAGSAGAPRQRRAAPAAGTPADTARHVS
jgi:hypothetical protein